MKKRVGLTVALATSLSIGSSLGMTAEQALAANVSDLENRQSQLENKRSAVQQSINEKSQKILELRSQQSKLTKELEKLDKAITKAATSIREKQEEVAKTKKDIEKLKKEIKQLKEQIAERNVVLKQRARSLQENGGSASYIDVLLGAKSFGDFINRATAATKLVNADKEILEDQEKDKKKLEKSEKEVEKKLNGLEEMLEELEQSKAGLEEKKSIKDRVMQQVSKEQKDAYNQKLSLEEERELLASQEAAIKASLASEKARIAKEQRERAARASAPKASAGSSSEGSGSSDGSPAVQRSNDAPAVSGGSFMRPAQGIVSSGYGMRSLGNHKGIDIANTVSVPIVAAADGQVIRSYYSNSYGNAIFISHNINGKVYTTVYAHMSERVVQGGSVSKGQVIGYMGNTGQSTGQHLHFEIHEGPWTVSKQHAVDPRKYVNF
ncbi:murein hydrolase activator EnvC family protein [Bacillus xiapuensis]|uniref:murein hydrolase activator EnvC family protein n=1 Tax=Bacillus xiapuensis TaxID=2014075 RepID=UPI001E36436D|nr:M23 family metallopeptidase [Bacillus xiapuensis]